MRRHMGGIAKRGQYLLATQAAIALHFLAALTGPKRRNYRCDVHAGAGDARLSEPHSRIHRHTWENFHQQPLAFSNRFGGVMQCLLDVGCRKVREALRTSASAMPSATMPTTVATGDAQATDAGHSAHLLVIYGNAREFHAAFRRFAGWRVETKTASGWVPSSKWQRTASRTRAWSFPIVAAWVKIDSPSACAASPPSGEPSSRSSPKTSALIDLPRSLQRGWRARLEQEARNGSAGKDRLDRRTGICTFGGCEKASIHRSCELLVHPTPFLVSKLHALVERPIRAEEAQISLSNLVRIIPVAH